MRTTIDKSDIGEFLRNDDGGSVYDTALAGIEVWISDNQTGTMFREGSGEWEHCEIIDDDGVDASVVVLGSIVLDKGTRESVVCQKRGDRMYISCGDENDIGPDDITTIDEAREWFRHSYSLSVWDRIDT